MPTIHLDKALESSLLKSYRWKSHNDWVEQIRIDRRLNQIISCSNDENYAVIIGCILPTTDISSHFPQGGAPVISTQSMNPASEAGQSNQQPNQANNQNPANDSNMSQQQQQSINQNVNNQTSTMTNANNFLNTSLNASMSDQHNKRLSNTTNQTIAQNRATTPQQHDKHKLEKQDQQLQSVQHIGSIGRVNELKRRPESNETVFKVNKGVKTFDFSFEKNLLITGGK
jgi:hypothetical protein